MDAFTEYTLEIEGLGTVTVLDPQGEPGYRVRLPDGQVTAFPAVSGEPSEANALADIAHAIANPQVPVIPVPSEVPAWRMHAVAEIHGHSAAIGAALSALEGPAKIVASAAWYQGNTIERHSATVVSLGAALGLTSEQLDALFIEAANLPV